MSVDKYHLYPLLQARAPEAQLVRASDWTSEDSCSNPDCLLMPLFNSANKTPFSYYNYWMLHCLLFRRCLQD